MEMEMPHKPQIYGNKNRLYISPTFDSSNALYY